MITEREKQIFALIKKGFTNKQIAQDLGISKNTVITILHRAFKKYKIQNRVQIAADLIVFT